MLEMRIETLVNAVVGQLLVEQPRENVLRLGAVISLLACGATLLLPLLAQLPH